MKNLENITKKMIKYFSNITLRLKSNDILIVSLDEFYCLKGTTKICFLETEQC